MTTRSSRRVLPSNIQYVYIGEGAANAVFSLEISSSTSSDATNNFDGTLLRVAKAQKAGSQTLFYQEQQAFFQDEIEPLMGRENVVSQELVDIPSSGTIGQLNAVLASAGALRPERHRGSVVADVEVGMLVQDMRPRSRDDWLIEFKPKWLSQSPSAVRARAKRCRNCAREAVRLAKLNSKDEAPSSYFCSLDLLNCQTDEHNAIRKAKDLMVRIASRYLSSPTDVDLDTPMQARLFAWLKTNTLIKTLRAVQLKLDERGVLDTSLDGPDIDSLAKAMTLRDCTVYLRIPASEDQPVEARLGDLDRKNAAVKLDYWKRTELELLEGGYYTEQEKPRQRIECALKS